MLWERERVRTEGGWFGKHKPDAAAEERVARAMRRRDAASARCEAIEPDIVAKLARINELRSMLAVCVTPKSVSVM